MKNKYLPALEEIVNEVQGDARGHMSLDAFGNDILPLLMSNDPQEQQLGRQRHLQVAKNNPFNEIELLDENGNIKFILPPAMAKIPSLKPRSPIEESKVDFMIAHSQDMMFGREPSSLNSMTGELYKSLSHEYESIGDAKTFIIWDQIVTYFGYPSFFSPEEKKVLVERGMTFEWGNEARKRVEVNQAFSTTRMETTEETYEEDDWEM